MGSFVGKRLAQRGFFPSDIPPSFSSEILGANYRKIFNGLSKELTATWTQYEPFSLPRSSSGRRVAGIVNPIPFIGLSEEISQHWRSIRNACDRSKISFSVPRFSSRLRAITDSDFRAFRDAQITQSTGYSHVLYADFSRYFPTIYTHALEWAAHGKAVSKNALGNRGKSGLWASGLDRYVRAMQDGQTQGIPIGPDTSFIVAELLSSAIDAQLQRELGEPLVGARLIDDYVLYFESRMNAERAQSVLHRVVRDFQVELNPEKTKIETVFSESREAWTYRLAEFGDFDGIRGQRRSLIRYTDQAISLYHQIGYPAIGRYAVKVISGAVIHPENIDVALACLMRLGRLSPGSIQDVAKFCVAYHKAGFAYSKPAVTRFVNSTLAETLDVGHDCEASWLMWMAINVGVKVAPGLEKPISRSHSSVILLLGKLAEQKGLTAKISQSVLPSSLRPQDFYSQNWLLAYEGSMKGWFGWNQNSISGSILELLTLHKVEFLFDRDPEHFILKAKTAVTPKQLINLEFDQLDEFFETDVEEDGYDVIDHDEVEEEESCCDEEIDFEEFLG